MTPESMCNRPKLEGAKLESNGAMESANEKLPVTKGEALLKLLQDLEIVVDRHCLDHGHG